MSQGHGSIMRDRVCVAAAALALVFAAGCGDSGSGTGDDVGGTSTEGTGDTGDVAEPVWEEAFDTTGAGSLSGVWGSGPDDVFMVGGDGDAAAIFHWDGADWSAMDAPDGAPLMVWAYGFGADDVWAVGLDGVALRYDGATWTAVDTGLTDDIWGVFGHAPDDLWIVGGDPTGDAPITAHWDGQAFTPVELAAEENDRQAVALFKVWGIDDLLFAVGQSGLIVRWDGEAWKQESAGAKADQDFVSLWGTSADHIVAVGGRGNARISVYDGEGWETTAPSGYGGLNAVFMGEPDEAVIGGIYGYVGRFDATTGELTDEVAPTGLDVHAMWGDGAGRHYAVGGTFTDPHEGVALVRTWP